MKSLTIMLSTHFIKLVNKRFKGLVQLKQSVSETEDGKPWMWSWGPQPETWTLKGLVT